MAKATKEPASRISAAEDAEESANGSAANGQANGQSNGHSNGHSKLHLTAESGTGKRRATAESMATKQRDISVSEFFAKNRHLLGFDNPRKALLTTVKEAVDNSLDACEEAGLVPEIWVAIEATGNNRFKVSVQDNGPGIVKKQIPLIFGKLLYGSKFHRLRMSRGQQGIGISAAGMYGMLTTGKPVKIISKISIRKPAHYFELQIDTKRNHPEIIKLQKYLQQKFGNAAKASGASIIFSNHSMYDQAWIRSRWQRKPGETSPFVVGTDGVARYATVLSECAKAAKLRLKKS